MTGVTRGARSGQETILPGYDGRRIAIAYRARTMVDVLDNPRLGGGTRRVAKFLSAYLEDHDPHVTGIPVAGSDAAARRAALDTVEDRAERAPAAEGAVVITVRELQALSAEWASTTHVIEKDWALGWVLAGIGAQPELSTWVFKGGTSLRKCYHETYRFSEDLDFTVVDGGLDDPEFSLGRHPRTHHAIAMSSQ